MASRAASHQYQCGLPACSPKARDHGLDGTRMMELFEKALRGILLFAQEALTGGNVWILMLIVIVAIGVIASMRGKLTEGWLWIPVLALAMWYALYRWLQLR